MLRFDECIYSLDELIDYLTYDGIRIELEIIERARKGDSEAFYLIGEKYYLKDSYLKAIIWFLKSAYKCNNSAQYYIGRMFDYGLGVPELKIKALKWYHRSTALENTAVSLRIKKLNSEGYYLDAIERATIINEMTLPESKKNYQEVVHDLENKYQVKLKIQQEERKELMERVTNMRTSGTERIEDETQLEIKSLQEQVQHQVQNFKMYERKNHELSEKIGFLENQRLTLEGRIQSLENDCEKKPRIQKIDLATSSSVPLQQRKIKAKIISFREKKYIYI